MFAAVHSQSLSELPSFPEERGMGRRNAFSSFPASEFIRMEWQACPHNPGSLSPFPKASIPHSPCYCQAMSRNLEGSVYLVCVGKGSEPTMPDAILNSFVTSLYRGYKTVQQPLAAHSGNHAMLSAPEHTERHQVTQARTTHFDFQRVPYVQEWVPPEEFGVRYPELKVRPAEFRSYSEC